MGFFNRKKTNEENISPKEFDQEFTYDPINDQVRFNVVPNPDVESSYFLIMELYDKEVDVLDKDSKAKNEIVLKDIKPRKDVEEEIIINDSDSLDLARFYKYLGTNMNEIINDKDAPDSFKSQQIAEGLSSISAEKADFRSKFSITDTPDGTKFTDALSNKDREENNLKLSADKVVTIKKSLKRQLDPESKNFGKVVMYPKEIPSWANGVEKYPPVLENNPLDTSNNLTKEVAEKEEI